MVCFDELCKSLGEGHEEVSLISALATQLELLGSPPDSVSCLTMRGGPPIGIIMAKAEATYF